jgi:hypothetical protein
MFKPDNSGRVSITLLICSFLSSIFIHPSSGRASYYDLVPSSKTPLEVVTYDARYPYWTKSIYIATYPHHAMSTEGWNCEYYGGVQLNSAEKATHLLWSTWGITGAGAPSSGIDFVFAGDHMGWHRSTWEGSSGGVSGMWPSDEFKIKQWYRFVHRVWTPTDHTPHLGYAGVWIQSLETGEWHHTATFKFPAELTGFNNMGGFTEYFGGDAPDKAAVEFRNCYTLTNGRWTSRVDFTAKNHKADTITLKPGENGIGVLMETTKNPRESGSRQPSEGAVVSQKFTLRQPPQPDFFQAVKIKNASAEWLGDQLVVRWTVDIKSTPQLGYDVEAFDGSNQIATKSWNDPEACECTIMLPAPPTGPLSVRLALRDIYNQKSVESRFEAKPGDPLSPVQIGNLSPGLSYQYYETARPESWSSLPDFASLKSSTTGVTAVPDITPRLKRNGYAFAFDGYLRIPTDGLYTFNLAAASGAELTIDRKVIINADGDRSIAQYPGAVALMAGVHPIHIGFYHGKGRANQADDFLQMTWAGPGFATAVVPASAFAHFAKSAEPVLKAAVHLANGIAVDLSSHLTGSQTKVKRVEYYAVDDHFDYFAQQGAQSANYFLAGSDLPEQTVSTPIWGGETKTIFARVILADNRTVDSAPVVVHDAEHDAGKDSNGMVLTVLEHHLYPPNSAVENGTITLVGDSMNLLTRPQKGDVTIIAHLTGITSDRALTDGTHLESAGNWFSGIILRNSLQPRQGEPFGGAQIPYIMVGASADGATRHCDSTMINGAGNQLSGDVGSNSKWFKLTRKGQQLAAFISQNGTTWRQVASIQQPKMNDEIQVGFIHYSIPCAVPAIHWSTFDHLSILNRGE